MLKGLLNTWSKSLELIITRREILIPYIIIGFVEGLALEVLFFLPRKPLAFIAAPIIRKFFGEAFLHYPTNLVLLSKLFSYTQLLLYIVIGVFLMGLSVNIFKNMKSGLPLKPNALIKNAGRNYRTFFLYGAFIVFLILAIRRLDLLLIGKFTKIASAQFPNAVVRLKPFLTSVTLFMTNLIMQIFFITTLPIIVLKKKPLIKALGESALFGLGNFFTMFFLFLPFFLVYFIMSVLKNLSIRVASFTFPELILYTFGCNMLLTVVLDCFLVICASQFLLDREKTVLTQ